MLTRRSVLIGATALAGCGARLHDFPFDGAGSELQGLDDDLRLRFYSVGCFHLQWRDQGVLTDPFFTHLPFGRVAFGRVEPDPAAVEPVLGELSDVRAVVIGHSHYDHCLALSEVAGHLHPSALLCGSATAARTFAPLELPREWVMVNERLATAEKPGSWIVHPEGKLRVLPILSGHPDNIRGIHLYQRRLEEDRKTAPRKAGHYQEGVTVAWLIDWLDEDGQIAHRVYQQTSSVGPPAGLAPASVFEERRIDLALLAMDCANLRVRGEPSILDHIDPRQVMFCHWGDFFRSKDKVPREGVKVNLPKLQLALRAEPGGERYLFPGWGARFRFPRNPA